MNVMGIVSNVTVLGLAAEELTMWYIALGIGLVVVIVVIALLTLLLKLVKEIDRGVLNLWQTATRMAANTATTWQIGSVAETTEKLREELVVHDRLLEQR